MADQPIKNISGEVDGASTEGHVFDTEETYTTPGAKVAVFKTGGNTVASIARDGTISSANEVLVSPDEGFAGIDSAVTSLNASGGGKIVLLDGEYSMGSSLYTWTEIENIEIVGKGDATKIMLDTSPGVPLFITGTVKGTTSVPVNDTTAGDTSITFTTPANAGTYLKGYWISLALTDDETGDSQCELVKVAADGNPGTGVVDLEWPVGRDGTSVTAWGCKPAENIKISNLRFIRENAPGGTERFMDLQYLFNFTLDSVSFETDDATGASDHAFRSTGYSGFWHVHRNRIVNTTRMGMHITGTSYSEFTNNYFMNSCQSDFSDSSCIWISGRVRHTLVKNNQFVYSKQYGVRFDATSGYSPYFMTIKDNEFLGIENTAINIGATKDTIIEGNKGDWGGFQKSGSGVGVSMAGAERCRITNNTFVGCAFGIGVSTASKCTINHNTIYGRYYGDGISCGGNGNNISNNVITNVGYGITVGSDAQRNVISSNTVVDVGSTHAIRVNTTAHNNVFIGNVLMGCNNAINLAATTYDNIMIGNQGGEEGIVDAGTNNQQIGNFV